MYTVTLREAFYCHLEKPFIVRVNEKMLIYSHYQYSKYLYVQLVHNVMQSLSF